MEQKEEKFKSFEDRLSRAYEILLGKIEKREALSESQATIFKSFCDYASNYFDAKQYQEFSSEQERDPMQGIKEEKRALTYDLIRNRVVLGERPTQEERLFMRLYCAEHGIESPKTNSNLIKKSDEEREEKLENMTEGDSGKRMFDGIKKKILEGRKLSLFESDFLKLYCEQNNIEFHQVNADTRKKSDEEPSR